MVVLTPLLAACAACTGDGGGADPWTQSDSAGISILESTLPVVAWSVSDDALTRIIGIDARPVDRDRFVEHFMGLAPDGRDPAIARRNALDQFAMVPPDHGMPPFDDILTDATGHVWVRDYLAPWESATPQHWTILDAEGRPVARVTTPAGVNVTHVALDRVTGITTGTFDEQYVVVHDLTR